MAKVEISQARNGLTEVLKYAHPRVYLDKEITIHFPWGKVSNIDGYGITDFVLMAKLADEMGFFIEITG